MPKATTARNVQRRPDMERIYGLSFVHAAVSLGYDRTQAMNAWRYLVQSDKGGRYSATVALAEYLVKGRLRAIIRRGPQRFSRTSHLWPIMSNVANKLLGGRKA